MNDLPRWYHEHCDVFSLCELVGGCDQEEREVIELLLEPSKKQEDQREGHDGECYF